MSRAAYTRAWRAAHPGKAAEHSRTWRASVKVERPTLTPEQKAARARDLANKANARYRARHPERVAESARKYQEAHRGASEPIAEACAFCHLGPCKGVCDAC